MKGEKQMAKENESIMKKRLQTIDLSREIIEKSEQIIILQKQIMEAEKKAKGQVNING